MTAANGAAGGPPFSLVQGGPLYHLLRRARLSDRALGLAHRRVLVAVLLGWAPLAAFSSVQEVLGRTPAIPFLADIGVHLRFLAVVPLLIFGERLVHHRLRPVIEQFAARGLVPPDQQPSFDAALAQAARWRNSMVSELLLLGLVYAVGVAFTLRRYQAFGGDAWYASGAGGVSAAGLWLVFVSLPLLQFLMLRWYFRLFIWARFLWRVSRLELDLNAVHPDRSGGLGFLGESLAAFTPIAVAHGLLFAGMIADRIAFAGASIIDFQVEIAGGALLLALVFAGPLLVFAPRLARTRRAGLRSYGLVGQAYAHQFREKWLRGGRAEEEPLLGSGDIQSLADLGNSYAAAEGMRLAPIGLVALGRFVGAFLAPILPLILTTMSPEKLLERLVGLVF
jgi:hypothetical protein